MTLALGIDIGGTKIAFVVLDLHRGVTREWHIPTEPQSTHSIADRITEQIIRVQNEHTLDAIGIGSPGFIKQNAGIVRSAVNLHWDEYPLLDKLRANLQHCPPLFLENDVNISAFGEYLVGVGKDANSIAYLAIGTGLGAGAVVDGMLITGATGAAMELGHIPLDANGRACYCGGRGCPEQYVSGNGLIASYASLRVKHPNSSLHQLDQPTTYDILTAADTGDGLALEIMSVAQQYLAKVIMICIHSLEPELIVIGGGLGIAGQQYFIEDMPNLLAQMRVLEPSPPIELPQINNNAENAAWVAIHHLDQS